MLDGALSMGDPGLAHVTWLTPMEVFEIKLRALIGEMLDGKRPSQKFLMNFESDARKTRKHFN